MKVIGLTGPTGGGKTTVLGILTGMGLCPIDCDALYHRLLAEEPALVEELTDRFGRSILKGAGALDRRALGTIVFSDPAALADLNAITHRYVTAAVDEALDRARAHGAPGAVIDAVALIESGLSRRCDAVAAVLAPPALRLSRIMVRDGLTARRARERIQAQPPDSFYRAHCAILIENDGSLPPETFRAQVEALFRPILNHEGGTYHGKNQNRR